MDKILGSRTKINALAVLLAKPERNIVENELAKEAGMAVSEINRQMRGLVNSGLVVMERIGRTKVYKINPQHFLYKPLGGLFRGLERTYEKAAREIVKFVTRRHKVRAVILFGSLSKGRIRSDFVKDPSDIDLVVVAYDRPKQVEDDLLDFINSKISVRYGIVVYPIVLSTKEYKARLSKDKFIINIHARGEVLYGEKPRRFG